MTLNASHSRFQSYIVVAPTQKSARVETGRIAASLGIDLEKVSGDIYFIKAAKEEISIDQIREIKSHIYQKPLQYAYKFVVIENAHNATLEAQNSLLKLLEEPPRHAVLVLEAKNKHQLLPTVVSRTVIIQNTADKTDEQTELMLENSLEEAFQRLGSIENPQDFLDRQILGLIRLMESKAKGQRVEFTYSQLSNAVENCAYTKELINSNVNPTFAMANLVLLLNLRQF